MNDASMHTVHDFSRLEKEIHKLINSESDEADKREEAVRLLNECRKQEEFPKLYVELLEAFNPENNLYNEIDNLLNRYKNHPFLSLQKGIKLLKEGKLVEAETQLEVLKEDSIKTDYPFIYWAARRNWGILLEAKGLMEKAREEYGKILEEKPDDAYTYAQLAVYYFKERDEKNAQFYIDKAYEFGFDNEQIINLYRYVHNYKDTAESNGKDPKKPCPDKELLIITSKIRDIFKLDKKTDYLNKIKEAEEKLNNFINENSLFEQSKSFFLVLRKWNSYTPILPVSQGEKHIGGGYFVRHKGKGTVIDPGFNFIENFENAGGRLVDIDNIIITHAHNDHTADFESILTLLYRHNKEKKKINKPLKKIDLYMNMGAFLKFSRLLDFREREYYINKVYTLSPDREFTLNDNGIQLTALQAYHDEMITRECAVGLKLKFCFNTDKTKDKAILLTSDTGLFPQKKNAKGEIVADITGEEIWKTYKLKPKSINLLIVHIGSIMKEEINVSHEISLDKIFYLNHLGIIGTCRLISALKPSLAIVSEWGEELKEIREELMNDIDTVIAHNKKSKILPSSTAFIYDIAEEKVYCICCGKMEEIGKIKYHEISDYSCELINGKVKEFYFHCDQISEDKKYNITDCIKKFKEALKNHKLDYFQHK